MTDNRILSREIRQVGIGESKTYTADFTSLLYGLTLASVTSVTHFSGQGLTLGSGTVNASAVTTDVGTIAIGKGVQFSVAPSGSSNGAAVVKVIAVDTAGNVHRLDAQFYVTGAA